MDHFHIKFPSGGLVYQGVDLDKIQIRTLRGKDEKFIAEAQISNLSQKFTEVFGNVLEGIDPKQLTLGDRNFLLLWEAINSYSPQYPIEYACSTCAQTNRNILADLSKIEIKELDPMFIEPYSLSISPSKTLKVRLLRVADEIKINEWAQSGRDAWAFRIGLMIAEEGMSELDKENMVQNMPSKETALIRGFQEKYEHGPTMKVMVPCPKCGTVEAVSIPFRLDMFIPYGERLTDYFNKTVQSNVLPTHAA